MRFFPVRFFPVRFFPMCFFPMRFFPVTGPASPAKGPRSAITSRFVEGTPGQLPLVSSDTPPPPPGFPPLTVAEKTVGLPRECLLGDSFAVGSLSEPRGGCPEHRSRAPPLTFPPLHPRLSHLSFTSRSALSGS